VIRICVIVLVAWIALSVPTVLLFGVLVRAGRRPPRQAPAIAGGATPIGVLDPNRTADRQPPPLGARTELLG
jgi:hypothetical protein